MGFFSSGKGKTEVIDPLAGQKTTAADYLTGLLDEPAPRQEVAGMTGLEREGQIALGDYFRGAIPTELQTSADFFSSVIGRDPSDVLRSIEDRAMDVAQAGGRRGLRRTQLGGMPTSGVQNLAQMRPFAEAARAMSADSSAYLNQLLGLQTNAAQGLANIGITKEGIPQGRLATLANYGALPRQLDQAGLDALFNQLLFGFGPQADVASRIGGMNIDTVYEPGAPSLFAQAAPMLGTAAGMALMGPLGGALAGKLAGEAPPRTDVYR